MTDELGRELTSAERIAVATGQTTIMDIVHGYALELNATSGLVQGKYTKAAQAVYLAVFENRDWDARFNYLDGNKGIYNDPTQGGRAVKREEWF